ncbi:MAG TPA: DUF2934 domain-containing protein [bacterium]|nr:DUF2934 domain-containing protein [bacterium]
MLKIEGEIMAKKAKPAGTGRKKKETPNLADYQAEISERAKEIYAERTAKNEPGDAMSDWLEAEKQISKKHKF